MSRANVDTVPINHEDLSDELVLLNADDTVFGSTVRKGKPLSNVVGKHPVDKRLSGRLGGLADGEDVDRSTVTNFQENRDEVECIVQHFRETHGVTKLQAQVMDPAGIDDAWSDGRVKALVRLKEDRELTFLSQQDCKKGSTASGTNAWDKLAAAYHTRGASAWISSSAQPNSTYAVPSAFRPASTLHKSVASVSAITEASLRDEIKLLRQARKAPVKLSAFCTLDYGTQIDSFFTEQSTSGSVMPVRRFNSPGDQKTYEIGITRYKTRFGFLDVIPTTYLNAVRDVTALAGISTTNGDATVTVTSTEGLQPYMKISGTGIPAGAYILSITNGTTFEMSANATASGSPTDAVLGEIDHALYLDMEFFMVRTNMAPQGYELPITGGGRDGAVESMEALVCTYPAVHGRHYTA